MEVFTLFGTDEHKEKYLRPLLEGTMASAFAMTEPAVASSDATNVEMRMDRTDEGFVLNGRKWFASNGMHPNCRVLIVMGKTDPTAEVHRQQSMLVVPIDAPGVKCGPQPSRLRLCGPGRACRDRVRGCARAVQGHPQG